MKAAPSLLSRVRTALAAAAQPDRAPRMQAYMKSEMPYHGVPVPAFRKLIRPLLAAHPVENEAGWRRDVLALWRGAKFREERYAALSLAADRRAKSFRAPTAMDLYEELVVTGAWWDYVDDIAVHQIGPILDAHRSVMKPVMLAWSRDEDIWKRRTSIICQVASKQKTDLDLLFACIEPSLGSKEFFLRKAIGWALRQHAWIDADSIRAYLERQGDRLSPLSRREALINLDGKRRAVREARAAKATASRSTR